MQQRDCAEGQRYTDADNLKNIADLKSFYSVPSIYDDEDDSDTETADASKGKHAQEEESGGKENDAKEDDAKDVCMYVYLTPVLS